MNNQKKYILSLDQGTTSSRAIIFDETGEKIAVAQKEFPQIFPQSGWVEHNPMDILNSQLESARECIQISGISPSQIVSIGIANQRETVIMWEKSTGKPVCNAIVWQCRRTADFCKSLEEQGLTDFFREKTGLIIDPYFSATKIRWILDNIEGVRQKAENGEILFGTVDSWLIRNLTGGKVHATDYTNASRTMLFNIHTLEWDREILSLLDIPIKILPEVKNSSGLFGYTNKEIFGEEIPITGCAGDQQSALFGQLCFERGDVKNTYGTGGFLLMNTGDKPVESKNGLLTTIGWGIGGKITYALEGSVFVSGAVVKWLRDEMKLIDNAQETEELALSVPDTNGVYFVPAFVGLGTPYWDSNARGAIFGLTRGAGKAHIVRSALEAIAYQTADVIHAMEEDTGLLNSIKVDGGASQNNFLMGFQADILNRKIMRPQNVESTAMGVALLSGLGVGVWKDISEISEIQNDFDEFSPKMSETQRQKLTDGWEKAVKRTLQWEN